MDKYSYKIIEQPSGAELRDGIVKARDASQLYIKAEQLIRVFHEGHVEAEGPTLEHRKGCYSVRVTDYIKVFNVEFTKLDTPRDKILKLEEENLAIRESLTEVMRKVSDLLLAVYSKKDIRDCTDNKIDNLHLAHLKTRKYIIPDPNAKPGRF